MVALDPAVAEPAWAEAAAPEWAAVPAEAAGNRTAKKWLPFRGATFFIVVFFFAEVGEWCFSQGAHIALAHHYARLANISVLHMFA